MGNKKIKITAPVGAPPFNLGLFVGDVLECEEKQAALLVEAGRAQYVTQPTPTPETAAAKIEPETATANRKQGETMGK